MAKPVLNADLTGIVFGKLTAVRVFEKGPRGAQKWLCKCSCGTEVVLPQKRLQSGNTTSCGHLKAEVVTARNKALAKDLAGKQIGSWKVESLCPHRNKEGGLIWNCVCICGTKAIVSSARLLRGRSIQCKNCDEKQKIKRFCSHGHDTDIWGRDTYGACRGCLRERSLRSLYGITLEEYQELHAFQKGLCAICGTPLINYLEVEPMGKRAEVDHEHGTEKTKKETVRGLLCGGPWAGCNNRLGKVDDIKWLKNAVKYLSKPPARELFKKGQE